MIVGLNGGCFHNYGFKLFSGKPISQCVAASFLSIVVVLITLAALFAIFILHSRESELYRYILDGTSAVAWELPFSRCLGHLSSI